MNIDVFTILVLAQLHKQLHFALCLSVTVYYSKTSVKRGSEWFIALFNQNTGRKCYFVNIVMLPWTWTRSTSTCGCRTSKKSARQNEPVISGTAGKPLRTSRCKLREHLDTRLTWPGQTKQLRCPERPDQDVLWEQTQVFQRVQLLEQTQAFFSTFLHCNVLRGQNRPERLQMLNQAGQLCYQTQTGFTGGSAAGCLA